MRETNYKINGEVVRSIGFELLIGGKTEFFVEEFYVKHGTIYVTGRTIESLIDLTKGKVSLIDV